jgi:hypothetical protein
MGFVTNAIQSVAQAFTPQNNTQAGGLSGTGSYTQQNFLDAIQQAQNQYNTASTGQNALATTLQGQVNGQGPNLANAQLEQGTNANIQKAASLIASQKGISPALAAREAATGAAASNQAAAGQAQQGVMQQTLNAEQGLGSLYGQEANESTNQQGTLQNANAQQNAQLVNQNLGVQGINAGVAAQNTQNNVNTMNGIVGSAGKAATMMATGGEVHPFHAYLMKKYAVGGGVDPVTGGITGVNSSPYPWMNNTGSKDPNLFGVPGPSAPSNPTAGATNAVSDASGVSGGAMSAGGAGDIASELGPLAMVAAHGGRVPALVSPGEIYLNRHAVRAVNNGADPTIVGERIPGHAKVQGNSYENDTVPKELEEGGEVIPRSNSGSSEKAMAFVEELKKKDNKKGYGSVLEAKRHFEEGMKHLAAMKGAS